jgi:hypothetical protein
MNEIGNIISQLEDKRAAIERALAALRDFEGEGQSAAKRRGRPPGKKARGGKRHMSAEGRAHIAEGVRRRWAKKRAAEASARKKGGMTAAGRKRLSELMKARWASKNPPKRASKGAG